jgi:ABC-type cobalamin/Fe3+-siderophores transport system ATPase subunit
MSELLRLTGVSKTYRRGPRELCVLAGVSLDVQAGEVVCVLGERGQGKTTLLQIAAGMKSADSGLVSFRGRDLMALSDAELSRLRGAEIAWAGKRGPRTRVRMFDYVVMPLLARAGGRTPWRGWRRPWPRRRGERGPSAGRDVEARAWAALERVGAGGCAEQEWETMSDWERALVEVAQAIAGEPALLLVDDVTDTLGIRETGELTALLRSLSRDLEMGVLMSVSDPDATLMSDRIMALSGGRLSAGPRSAPGNVIEFPDPGPQRLKAGQDSSS